jgi:hypothetical protein
MVDAIESKLDSEEKHEAFVAAALRAREQMTASGKAYDGDEFLGYMRARLRGDKVARPRAKSLPGLLKKPG